MEILKFLTAMKHSPIYNYGGIPGLTSWLIGSLSEHGAVRLMECSRTHYEPIIPHSHRFDFHCQVLAGEVRNIIWTPGSVIADEYIETELTYLNRPGRYEQTHANTATRWTCKSTAYKVGEEYSMKANEVHSIFFSRDAVVLFFEGPTVTDKSIILEPFVNGEVIPTFKVEPWMFKKGVSA